MQREPTVLGPSELRMLARALEFVEIGLSSASDYALIFGKAARVYVDLMAAQDDGEETTLS